MLLLGAVTYSGALTISSLAGQMGYTVSLQIGALAIGLIAGAYVFAGGLKACAWADLIQGSALILGGAIIVFFAFDKLGNATEAAQVMDLSTGAVAVTPLAEGTGSIERFWELNKIRMNMFLPATDSILPWTALLLGLWIPNFYYWGLNQYITQRTLGSQSLAEGQRGIVFAAFMKLLIPFVIVIPGIIAFNLFFGNMQLDTVADNAPVIARYFNPKTQLVQVQESPADEAIAGWTSDKFMIAVYADEKSMNAAKERNAFVLPITKARYDALAAPSYTVFGSEDKAWKSAFPALAEELEVYNAATQEAAKAAGATTSTAKFIAYKYDTALAQLLGNVLPQGTGLVGFVLAALLGAVVSSLAAMLNAASTIFTMDIYKKYLSPQADQAGIVRLGRICVAVFSVIAIGLAPLLGDPKISNSIFTIIQEGQIVAYGALKVAAPQIQFLNRMAICFGLCLVVMEIITLLKPLEKPVEFKQNTTIELHTSKGAKTAGIAVVVITLVLYFLFSPWGLIK
jgi:SSS family solute:Na+ symporter